MSDRSSSRGALSKGFLVFLGLVVLGAILLGSCGVRVNNGAVTRQTNVEAQWSNIQNMYKRRADLVPQLVEVVKGAANYEESVLKSVVDARASVGRVSLPEKLPTDEAELKRYIEAQQSLGASLSRLFAVAEAYPQLKATQNYQDLQSQLEGTENRIAVARTDYITAVRDYNAYIRRFPNSIIASWRGFTPAAQITVEESATQPPKIDLSRGQPK